MTQKITRIKHVAEETESGLMVPKTIIETKENFHAVQYSSTEWKVVSASGVTERIYTGTDAKENAEMYAGKLSRQFR